MVHFNNNHTADIYYIIMYKINPNRSILLKTDKPTNLLNEYKHILLGLYRIKYINKKNKKTHTQINLFSTRVI